MSIHEYRTEGERAAIISAHCIGGESAYRIEDYEYPDKKVLKIDRKRFYDEQGNFEVEAWLDEVVRPKREQLFNAVEYLYNNATWGLLTPENQSEWLAYNRALKDIPQILEAMNLTAPVEIPWPTRPDVVQV